MTWPRRGPQVARPSKTVSHIWFCEAWRRVTFTFAAGLRLIVPPITPRSVLYRMRTCSMITGVTPDTGAAKRM